MNAFDWKKGLLAGLVGVLAASANATSITSLLNLSANPALGTGSFAIVTLTQNGATAVDVNVSLAGDVANVAFDTPSAGPAHAFVFNLDLLSPFEVTIISPASGFHLVGAGQSNFPYGEFTYAIDCFCGPSQSALQPGPLLFEVTDLNGVSLSDFVANSGGFFFSAYVAVLQQFGSHATGNVASDSVTVVTVAEPATVLLIGIGLIGFWLCARPRLVARQ